MRIALGIDCSTQSITGVAVNVDKPNVAAVESVNYVQDIENPGIDSKSFLVAPRVAGEADQPPLLLLRALDLLFEKLAKAVDPTCIRVVNVSAQQHSHVYLSSLEPFRAQQDADLDLAQRYADAFSYRLMPTWMTSNTASQVEDIKRVLAAETLLELSGSDLPLRFSAAVIRRVAEQFPDAFAATKRIHLLSSFLSAVLSGEANSPLDYGNASGTSLMDYKSRCWSPRLLAATLPEYDLAALLPPLAPAHAVAGKISPYFHKRYSLPQDAAVLVGSGDNPQTKALSDGDLLSLGSSFVFMSQTQVTHPYINAMYDGFDRAFSFACRTNGALCWDRLREACGVPADDFKTADAALEASPVGSRSLHWFPLAESFPPAPADQLEGFSASVADDYPALVDTSLAELCALSSRIFSKRSEPLYLCGGPARAVVERVSAFWDRDVVVLGQAGAGLGAAVVAADAILAPQDPHKLIASITGMEESYRAPAALTKRAQRFLSTVSKEFV